MRIQITNGMLLGLIINMIYAKAIGLTQGSMAREVGSDIWISTIFASLMAAILMVLIVAIIRRMPDGDLIKQSEKLLGVWFGKIIGLLFFFYFVGAYSAVMVTFVYHLKDYFLPEAPTWLFIISAVMVGGYGIHFGIEVIARMALIGVFSVGSFNILMLLGSLDRFDIQEFLPVLESGVGNTIWASRHNITDWTLVTMMVAIILPNVKSIKTWRRSNLAGILFGTAFVLFWPVIEVGALSADVVAQYVVSCMQMARSAQIGLYIHRYEMLMVSFYALSILTMIMVCLFCASVSIQRVFNLKDYRSVIMPVSLVLGGFSYWIVDDHARAMHFIENEWVGIALAISICVPLFIWLIGFALKEKLKNNKQGSNKEYSQES